MDERDIMLERKMPESATTKLDGSVIVIRVPAHILKVAARYAWDKQFGEHKLYVSDEMAFVKEVLHQLLQEDEAGDNMVHRMLDAAMVEVAEDGGEGVDERDCLSPDDEDGE
jgi:hypothetical protein